MIEQYLSNTNESATIHILQKKNETKHGLSSVHPRLPAAAHKLSRAAAASATTLHHMSQIRLIASSVPLSHVFVVSIASDQRHQICHIRNLLFNSFVETGSKLIYLGTCIRI